MNIYDKRQIKCSICGKFIGEIDVDAKIIFPLCKICKKREKNTIKKGISKILVPIDETKKSIKALDAAIYFGKHLGASITLLNVIPVAYMTTMSFQKMLKEMTHEGAKNIEKAKAYCQKKNTLPKYKIVRGDEPVEIVKFAKKHDFDLIVMGSSGKGVLKEIAFGSVSNYVMNNTKIPVVTPS
ncbi:universal stress protein [Nitrosopumilus piranensis]|uniref:UspA domain-containing protein n=1 Tax=Nitrosopumilus piranensis TaxID=1582439 RepID=A0A0C5BXS8_9ARCH|nr:universal stress protein [Nitrosopumilus piranensis]AJM93111.1 UspA domain-containing protein [Nitrosopumilus piranensis]